MEEGAREGCYLWKNFGCLWKFFGFFGEFEGFGVGKGRTKKCKVLFLGKGLIRENWVRILIISLNLVIIKVTILILLKNNLLLKNKKINKAQKM